MIPGIVASQKVSSGSSEKTTAPAVVMYGYRTSGNDYIVYWRVQNLHDAQVTAYSGADNPPTGNSVTLSEYLTKGDTSAEFTYNAGMFFGGMNINAQAQASGLSMSDVTQQWIDV